MKTSNVIQELETIYPVIVPQYPVDTSKRDRVIQEIKDVIKDMQHPDEPDYHKGLEFLRREAQENSSHYVTSMYKNFTILHVLILRSYELS